MRRADEIAAIPEAKAKPRVPFSRRATVSSSASRVELLEREQSYFPKCSIDSWAKVEAWYMGTESAPVCVSVVWPAWMIFVPNFILFLQVFATEPRRHGEIQANRLTGWTGFTGAKSTYLRKK